MFFAAAVGAAASVAAAAAVGGMANAVLAVWSAGVTSCNSLTGGAARLCCELCVFVRHCLSLLGDGVVTVGVWVVSLLLFPLVAAAVLSTLFCCCGSWAVMCPVATPGPEEQPGRAADLVHFVMAVCS